ncbi:MAG: TonB-dependent receptor [Bacteroidota bacterium]
MKSELLKLLMFASKQAFYVFLIQLITLQLLLAKPSTSQDLLRETTLSIELNQQSLVVAFKLLEERTAFRFTYGKDVIKDQSTITVKGNNKSLESILSEIARQSEFNFRRINDNIYVLKREKKEAVKITEEFVNRNITGKVIEADSGEPLVGATIRVKGTSIGTVADVDGNFRLSIPDDAKILVISYVGFVTQELLVGSRISFEILLKTDVAALEEVVVVGYGEQNKVNLTGSVAKVSGEIINQRPITQGTQALQGLTPGIFVNTNSGEPGNDDASVTIRGIGTFNNAEPLVLVDGIEAPLDNINPHDIESINILKDAASASIYGTRAANGVILITTKRGSEGKAVVTYNNSFSFTSPTVDPDLVLDTRQYLETYVDAAEYSNRNNPFTPELIDELAALGSTNWYDEYVNTGFVQDHNVSITGGSGNIKYRFSNRYFDQEGYVEGDWFTERLSSRLNLDMRLSDKLNAGISIAYTNTNNRQAPKNDPQTFVVDGVEDNRYTGGKGNFLYTILLVSPPNGTVYDEFGRYGGTGGESSRSQRDNPQGLIDNQWIDNDANELLGNAFIEYEPIKNFKLRYTTGVNLNQQSYEETRLEYEQYDRFGNRTAVRTPGSILRTREATTLNFTNWLQASYTKSFDYHEIGLMVGVNQETSDDRRIATAETGFGSTSLVQPGNGTAISDIQNYDGEWALQSVFGRVNYNYKGTYLFELNMRRDGSSRFGQNNRWASFPGVSAGYVISNENFWNSNFMSFLKLRASWGIIGVQSEQLYPFASEVTLGNDYNGNSGAALTKFGNPDLEWEETTTIDFGIDLELFDGKIYLEADYFRKESDGILTQINNPLTSGVNSATTINSANILNKGWELNLTTNNKIGDLRISANFNLSHLDNEVTKINSDLSSDNDMVYIGTGGDRNVWLIRDAPINAIYGHEFGGVFQTDDFNDDGSLRSGIDYSWLGSPRPGDIKYTDQNGDNIIDESDRVVIGDRNPEWLYGLNLNLDYKGFDLGMFFQGVGNIESWVNRYTGNFGHSGLREFWTNGWTEENPSNTIPRVFVDRDGFNGQSIEGLGGQAMNSFWVIDQSYLRLKNIVLGYSLPKKLLDRYSIERLRIYVSGQNLWTQSDLDDLDPERSQFSNHFGGTLPQAKSYTVGLNLTF